MKLPLNSSYKEIANLAIPNTISAITVPVLGMVDLAIMGHLNSEIYLDAIAIGGIIFSFIYSVFGFLRMGTSGFVAQFYGQKNEAKQLITLYRVFLFAMLGGFLLVLLQYPIEKLSFYLMDTSAVVEQNAIEYFRIRIWAAPASLGIIGLTGWFIGMQNAKAPMYIALIVNIVNISLSYILVYQFGFLSDGVAWGTLIAQYAGFAFSLSWMYWKYRDLLKTQMKEALLDWKELKLYMKVNTDILIRSVTLMFTFAFFTAVSAEFGDTILGVNALLLQFLMFFAYFTDGFAYAAESLSGKYIGAKDKLGFTKMLKSVFRVGWIVSLLFVFIYGLFGKNILWLMTDISEILEASDEYLFWLAILPITSIIAFVYDGIYIGALVSRPMRNTLLTATFLVFLPTYFLLRNTIGNHSLWLGLNLFMFTRSVLLWYFSKKLFSS